MKKTKESGIRRELFRCEECFGIYIVVYKCSDKKERCARCKDEFERRGHE